MIADVRSEIAGVIILTGAAMDSSDLLNQNDDRVQTAFGAVGPVGPTRLSTSRTLRRCASSARANWSLGITLTDVGLTR